MGKGLEILKSDGIKPTVIRAGNDNLFRSEIFANTVATLIEQEIEIYNTTGAIGAARACELYKGDFEGFGQRIMKIDCVMGFKPIANTTAYKEAYLQWKNTLNQFLNKN